MITNISSHNKFSLYSNINVAMYMILQTMCIYLACHWDINDLVHYIW